MQGGADIVLPFNSGGKNIKVKTEIVSYSYSWKYIVISLIIDDVVVATGRVSVPSYIYNEFEGVSVYSALHNKTHIDYAAN